MRKETAIKVAITISLAIGILRIILAFTNANFTYDSYYHLRHVEHIAQVGIPLFQDPLSYGGTTHYLLPLFHYIAAVFTLIFNIELVAKILPNLLYAALPFVIYKISYNITKNEEAGLMSALTAAFLPILFATNEFSPLPLTLLLFATTLYFFLKAKTKPIHYVTSFFLLTLASPSAGALLLGYMCYALLLFIEERKIEKYEREMMLFSLFFFLWIQLIFFKRILLSEGFAIVFQSIPQQLLASYFPKTSLWIIISIIGILPISAAIYVLYRSLFDLKYKKAVLFISLAISVGSMLVLQVMNTQNAYPLLALACAPLIAIAYTEIQAYAQKTRIRFSQKALIITTIILIVLTLAVPSIVSSQTQHIPSKSDQELFVWARENLPPEATLAALPEEGHLVTFISKKKNVIDTQFAGQKEAQERFEDTLSLYTTQFETRALEVTDKYEVTHIVMSKLAQEKYNRQRPPFAQGECLDKIVEIDDARIYQVTCTLQRTT